MDVGLGEPYGPEALLSSINLVNPGGSGPRGLEAGPRRPRSKARSKAGNQGGEERTPPPPPEREGGSSGGKSDNEERKGAESTRCLI